MFRNGIFWGSGVEPLEQEEKAKEPAKVSPALEAQQPVQLEEKVQPPIDYLEDIKRRIAPEIAKGLPVLVAVEAVATRGRILDSNQKFVAVTTGRQITILEIEHLKNMTYDGTGHDPFAKGNKLEINKTKEGLKTVVGEERPEVQTEAKKKIVRDRGVGRG